MRMASAAVKPCQGDSSEFYLITGSIYTEKRGTVISDGGSSFQWTVIAITTYAIQADCDVKATNIILQVNQQPQQPEFPQLDLGLTVLVFKQGDDPIDAINHMMSFLSAVVISRYPTTNNQLRNSSKPRQQAIINDRRVTLQPVQGRQISFVMGTTRTYTRGASRSNYGKQRTVICYNYKGEGHMSKQCTKPKRKRDDSWFKDKVLLVQAQANSQIGSWRIYPYGLVVLAEILKYDLFLQTELSVEQAFGSQITFLCILQITSPSCRPTKSGSKDFLKSHALKDELRKLKGKDLANNIVTKHTIAPEILKFDVEPIAPKLLNNRTAHSRYYLGTTQGQVHDSIGK
ncbi:hypothetical protein Tco_0965517 [Tanacetum coccineum]